MGGAGLIFKTGSEYRAGRRGEHGEIVELPPVQPVRVSDGERTVVMTAADLNRALNVVTAERHAWLRQVVMPLVAENARMWRGAE